MSGESVPAATFSQDAFARRSRRTLPDAFRSTDLEGSIVIGGVSINLALYLFLGGMGSGLYLVAFAKELLDRASRARQASAFPHMDQSTAARCASIAAVGLGASFLLLDLGVKDRAPLVFTGFDHSILSIGAWAIVLFLAFGLAAVALQFIPKSAVWNVVGWVAKWAAAVCALVVSLYTGLYLYLLSPAVPLWDNPLVVAVFFASSVSTGYAAWTAICVLAFEHSPRGLGKSPRTDACLKAVDGLALAAFAVMQLMRPDSFAQAHEMVFGLAALEFWGGAVLLGVVVPLVADLLARRGRIQTCMLIGSMASLVGGFALRCSIILL